METETRPRNSLSLPWRTHIYLWCLSTTTELVSRRDGTVSRNLLKLFQVRFKSNSNSVNGVKTYDVVMDPTHNIWFRVFVPTHHIEQNLPVILFFHGGGFVFLGPHINIYDTLCRSFAREAPAIVVAVDYRRAPEHRYPTQHNDCFDLLTFLDNQENKSKSLPANANISQCFLVGDSAGGNIAHHVAQRACEFDFKRLKVIGIVLIQPFFGGEEQTDSEKEYAQTYFVSLRQCNFYWNALMPPGYSRDHPVINVSGPNAYDILKINFPATMVVISGIDSLRDWQKRYYQWLKRSGKKVYLVDYRNMCHGFYTFPELPECGKFVAEVKEFMRKLSKNMYIIYLLPVIYVFNS
ncbi:probable carboxylesterase 18 [Rutidosis leptorrhynchoides]|uniref:probable carboxylesterase 18 n=1 Tax=Rutidosis leptorrhynchoides TaxID=125765 RepID=UPI003A99267E